MGTPSEWRLQAVKFWVKQLEFIPPNKDLKELSESLLKRKCKEIETIAREDGKKTARIVSTEHMTTSVLLYVGIGLSATVKTIPGVHRPLAITPLWIFQITMAA
jgi:hypothetical protein